MSNPQSAIRNPHLLVRPLVRELHPYVYGEQPKIKGLIKLNTTRTRIRRREGSGGGPGGGGRAVAAVSKSDGGAVAGKTGEAAWLPAGEHHRGQRLDELLALATRAFVEPVGTARCAVRSSQRDDPTTIVQYFTPSYSLYPVLADIHGAVKHALPLNPDFSLPSLRELKLGKVWDFARL